ncbi:hypothetical protein C8F04DRAFT_1068124, partial [Mycena alexandri]
MTLFPQELVNAFIHEIDDVPTLKASCLAGSVFREETQRILFRSVTTHGNPYALCGLLQESPHIAPYITSLDISFFEDLLISNTEGFHQIFRVVPSFMQHSCWLSSFSSRASHCANCVSLTPLPCYLSSACVFSPWPPLSFLNVYLADDIDFPMPDWQNPVPRVRDFTLGWAHNGGATGLEALLVRSHSKEGTPGFLRLYLFWDHDLSSSLVSATANTLEHIELEGALGSPIAIPPFPVLRSIKLSSLRFLDRYPLWLPNLISTILDRSPILTDLTLAFTLPFTLPPSSANTNPFHVSIQLLATLDTALVEHAAAPSLQWHLLPTRYSHRKKDTFTDFVTLVRRGMPRLDEQRRLTLEVRGWNGRYPWAEWTIPWSGWLAIRRVGRR